MTMDERLDAMDAAATALAEAAERFRKVIKATKPDSGDLPMTDAQCERLVAITKRLTAIKMDE